IPKRSVNAATCRFQIGGLPVGATRFTSPTQSRANSPLFPIGRLLLLSGSSNRRRSSRLKARRPYVCGAELISFSDAEKRTKPASVHFLSSGLSITRREDNADSISAD